jgi:hypothetical protein
MTRYDPLKPPAWVRRAMRDKSRVIKVNPNDPASFDAYIEGLARRAPKGWHEALDAIIRRNDGRLED